MKSCSGCSADYAEDFKFCPECGTPFGGQQAEAMRQKLNQNLMEMKRQAGAEAALSRQVFSGNGLGNRAVGRIYGMGHTENEWG